MTARMLDGTAVANQIRAEVGAGGRGVHGARRPSAGTRRSCSSATTRRPRSTSATSCKSAGEAGLRADLERLPATASLDELLAVVDRLNASDVHDGILVQSPLPGGDGRRRRAPGLRRDRSRQGRRRLSSGQRRPARAEPRDAGACTPSGVIELLERSAITDRRCARRRHRPQRHRRQADGAAAAAPPRDRHDLPLANARPAGGGAPGRHPRRGHRPAGVRDAGLRQAGRDRRRRRHQPGRRIAPWSSGCFRPDRSAARRSSGAARSSSATCIRTSRMWPARCRRCPAASAR